MKWPVPLNLYEDASKRLSSYKYGHDPVISVTVMPALVVLVMRAESLEGGKRDKAHGR